MPNILLKLDNLLTN